MFVFVCLSEPNDLHQLLSLSSIRCTLSRLSSNLSFPDSSATRLSLLLKSNDCCSGRRLEMTGAGHIVCTNRSADRDYFRPQSSAWPHAGRQCSCRAGRSAANFSAPRDHPREPGKRRTPWARLCDIKYICGYDVRECQEFQVFGALLASNNECLFLLIHSALLYTEY